MANYPNGSAATRYTPSNYLTPEYSSRGRSDAYIPPSYNTPESYYQTYSRSNPNLASPRYSEEFYQIDDHLARRRQYTPSRSRSNSRSDSDDERRSHRKHKHHHGSKSRSHTPNPLQRLSSMKDHASSTLNLPHNPSDEKHPGLAFLAAGTGAAAIAAADKYLLRGEKKEESTARLIADAAVGGLLGYGAYRVWDGEREKKESRERKRERRERRETEDDGGRELGRRRSFVEGYDGGDRYDDRRRR